MLLVELLQAVTFATVFSERLFTVNNIHFPCTDLEKEPKRKISGISYGLFIPIRQTKAFPQGTGVNSLLVVLLPEKMRRGVNGDEGGKAI